MFNKFTICLYLPCIVYMLANVAGLSLRLVPILTKAHVETKESHVRASVTINRYGSLQNFTMDLDITILKPIEHIKMNTGYFVRTRHSENWMYNKTFDFCEFLLRPSIDRFASLVYDDLRHHGPVPTRCPVPPGRILFTNNTLMHVRLPAYLPETSFGFTVTCFLNRNNEVIFRSYWYGRLKKMMV